MVGSITTLEVKIISENKITGLQGLACKVQKQILEVCSKYLKSGGELVYSTCSILMEENEKIIEKFLEKEKSGTTIHFEVICKTTILPNSQTDGFFICKLKKNA